MQKQKTPHWQKIIISSGLLFILSSSCAAPITTREKGALAGGALGAGAGAIIGNQVGHQGSGALIGGALGALGGGLVGDQMYGQELHQNDMAYRLEAQRREIERQRQELEALRREDEGYAPHVSPPADPYAPSTGGRSERYGSAY